MNEIVADGSCCWWLTISGAVPGVAVAMADSGMLPPAPSAMPVLLLPMPVAVEELLELTWPRVVALLPVSAPLPLLPIASWFISASAVRNSGATSSTTRYWLSWVKMVEIWRWP